MLILINVRVFLLQEHFGGITARIVKKPDSRYYPVHIGGNGQDMYMMCHRAI